MERVVNISVVAGRAPVTRSGADLTLTSLTVTLPSHRVTYGVVICHSPLVTVTVVTTTGLEVVEARFTLVTLKSLYGGLTGTFANTVTLHRDRAPGVTVTRFTCALNVVLPSRAPSTRPLVSEDKVLITGALACVLIT